MALLTAEQRLTRRNYWLQAEERYLEALQRVREAGCRCPEVWFDKFGRCVRCLRQS